MWTDTLTTGRRTQPLGKDVAKRPPQLIASAFACATVSNPPPGGAIRTIHSMLHCYIRVPVASSHSSLVYPERRSRRATSHCIFNRQPRRLEIIVSHTKQRPARQNNRQVSATSARRQHSSSRSLRTPRVSNRNTTPFRNRLTR